jgi:hypothetical protein
MGEVELDSFEKQLIIHSHVITYGHGATLELTEQIRDEIETMWNEPQGSIHFHSIPIRVQFKITAELKPQISDLEIYQNLDPRNNYFRIEEFAIGNISFVDGINCNSGFFLLENLYKGSTTAAHEYGHTIGLDHPKDLDLREKGVPGIMYPRGTLVDPRFQYDPSRPAGEKGGTMHPMHRRVLQQDIANLKLHKLQFQSGRAILGDFTNIFHLPHI